VGNCIFTAELLEDLLSFWKGTSIVPETHKHGNFGLLDQAKVHHGHFWVILFEPVGCVLLESSG